MTTQEQTDAFANDLDALIERYRREFDLTYAIVVGALILKVHTLCAEASQRNPDEEDQ